MSDGGNNYTSGFRVRSMFSDISDDELSVCSGQSLDNMDLTSESVIISTAPVYSTAAIS